MSLPVPARPIVRDAYASVSDADIRRFERQHGLSLPDQYKRFLLRTNGGCFYNAIVPQVGDSITECFAIDCEFESSDLASMRAACEEWVPDTLLPIAEGGGGDVYCISVESKSFGEVVHVTWESLLDLDPKTLVARSFDEFLNGVELDPNRIDSQKEEATAFYAADMGDVAWLEQALSGDPRLLQQTNSQGESMLHVAAFACQLEVARWILEHSADVNKRDPRGNPPLFSAVFLGSEDAVRLLVSHGCDLTAKNDNGKSAIVEAVERKQVRCAMVLWELMRQRVPMERYQDTVLALCQEDEDLMTHLAPIVERG